MTNAGPYGPEGTTSAEAVRDALRVGREIALLDVRAERLFATGHPLFAASTPIDRLEFEILDRVPRRQTPIVLYGDDGGTGEEVRLAREQLLDLGYPDVTALDGGLAGWQRGGELFADVNSPSKAFGELVAHHRRTPMIKPGILRDLLEAGADVVVVDVRRSDEYETMSIPSAVSVPGGELVWRIPSLVPDPRTLVVVNCAGRTRSIIGTQSLINADLPNRVVALENGTIGWTLAGFELQHSQPSRRPPAPPRVPPSAARARQVATKVGSRWMSENALASCGSGSGRTLYRFDVRTAEEYEAGHLLGFRWAPGGQLIQETDFFAPVRGGVIALFSGDGVRAEMTSSWLGQMGWKTIVVELGGGSTKWEEGLWQPRRPSLHPSRDADRYRRPYEGTDVAAETMKAYLDWEYGLVDQLERDGTHGFCVL